MCDKCNKETPDGRFCIYCNYPIKESFRDSENMIKGRIAETLIEELFITNQYQVHRFGMENTIPGLSRFIYKAEDTDSKTTAAFIRKMPDFVVQKGDTFFFLEVKYRSNEYFDNKFLDEGYPYENTYFIIVSDSNIKCISLEQLRRNEFVSKSSNNYISSCGKFQLTPESIRKFSNMASKFLGNGKD